MSGGPPRRVRISSTTSRVHVRAEPGAGLRVEGRAAVDEDDGVVTITRVRSGLTVVVAEGTDVVIGTSTGAIRTSGRLGHVAVTATTGRVALAHTASADVRVTTSKVTVESVAGRCRVHTGSGAVRIGSCGEADVSTRTGSVRLDSVAGAVTAHSISGRMRIVVAGPHDVHAETVTGRIEITMPRGTNVRQTSPGVHATPATAADCTVVARSTTGRVVLAYA